MFKKAERKQVKLKLAITGPSGSGKTYSALRLAKGLGKKIAVIDTENGSASLYADRFDFDVIELTPPFDIQKYTAAIEAAEKAGYDTIVIDSLTHAWAGEGGLLDQKATLDSRPGSNQWANWKPITDMDNKFKNAFLHSPCHIITTMRSKHAYEQADVNGKKKIVKLGMAPVQREGLEYEFTIVFDVGMDHKAEASKDRTNMFVDKVFQITEDTGKEILKWLNTGKTEPLDISEKPFDLSNEETIDQELEKVAKSIPNRATEYLANNEALNRTIRYGTKFADKKFKDVPLEILTKMYTDAKKKSTEPLAKSFIKNYEEFVTVSNSMEK